MEPGLRLLGLWIRDARVRAGLSQSHLGRLAGLHQSTISRLERGHLEGLRLHRLAIVVGVLNEALEQMPVRWA
jgi:transcriptional regulator with XRE-family HTH domain